MGNVTATLRNFSSSNNNSEWEISYDIPYSDKYFTLLFYANGNCKNNEGYVCIIFSKVRFTNNSEDWFKQISLGDICLHLSVVDVAGNKRFTQSVVVITHEVSHFGLLRYLKRETLLNDPAELLPDNCLTICVDVEHIPFDNLMLTSSDSTLEKSICMNGTETYIPLDTDFGKELCRVSKFFRRASVLPMMESRTRKVLIPEVEYSSFTTLWLVFNEFEELEVPVKEICNLYRLADKYDIQRVVEMCQQFIKAFLSRYDDPEVHEYAPQSLAEILELAEIYRDDDDLKETVQTYLENKDNFKTNSHAFGKHLKKKLQTEWECEIIDDIYELDFVVRISRRIMPEFYQ